MDKIQFNTGVRVLLLIIISLGIVMAVCLFPNNTHAVDLGCGPFTNILNSGYVYHDESNTLTGTNTASSYSCIGWDESGPELVYPIATTAIKGDLTATLSDLSSDLDIFILDSCDSDNCNTYGDDSASISEAPPATYYIVVDGYNGASGPFTLDVTAQCSIPVTLTSGVPYAGTTLGETMNVQTYSPSSGHSCSGVTEGGPEVIHQFTASAYGTLDVSLTGMSSNLDLFVVDNCRADECLASSTGTSDESIQMTVEAGQSYDIVVDGFGSGEFPAFGPYTLTATLAPELDCRSPVTLTEGLPYSGTTAGASSNVSSYACGTLETGPEVVHRITAPRSGSMLITLDGLSSDLDLIVAGSCSTSQCLGSSRLSGTLSESIELDVVVSNTYDIVVEGYNGAQGPYTLEAGFCFDNDNDGYGNPGDSSCDNGAETDCDDNASSVYPGAAEVPDDSIDQDCNGFDTKTCIVDADQDGYGTDLGTTTLAPDGTCDTTEQESGTSDDCNDGDAAVNPGAVELCDEDDNDCNDGTPDGADESWYNQSTTCGYGLCAGNTGQYECQLGSKVNTCNPLGGAGTENTAAGNCTDEEDNDCDGAVDNADGGCYIFGQESYEFKRLWPQNEQWNFASPYGTAIGKDSMVYVVDVFNDYVQVFSTDGNLLTEWGSSGTLPGKFKFPTDIGAGSDGSIYVVDSNNYRIQKFTASGDPILQWGTKCGVDISPSDPDCIDPDGTGDDFELGDGQFNDPFGISIDNDGNVYVADMGHNRIQKFGPDGEFLGKWGSYCDLETTDGCVTPPGGSLGDGQFHAPMKLAHDSSGYIYVVDSFNYRIQKFNPDHSFIKDWETLESGSGQQFVPWAVAVDNNGTIVVAGEGFIQFYDSSGSYQGRYGSEGYGDGEFGTIGGLVFDGNNNLYIPDPMNYRVGIFHLTPDRDVMHRLSWTAKSSEDGKFVDPHEVHVSNNTVYVTDNTSRVQLFSADGMFQDSWDQVTDARIQKPGSIYTDSSGSVYIYDNQSIELNRFSSSGQFEANILTGYQVYNFTIDILGNIYTSDQYGLHKFSSSGVLDTQVTFPDYRGSAYGITVDNAGFIYIASSHGIVQKFDPNGKLVLEWNSPDGPLSPRSITADSKGFIYVVYSIHNKIEKYTADGAFIGKIGAYGLGPGQFSSPVDVHVTGNDDIYVTDRNRYRVQVFRTVTTGSNNKAIVVAGGGKYEGNNLWDATRMNTNYAYSALNYQGFSKGRIKYFSEDDIDIDRDGQLDDIDDVPTIANIKAAICGTKCDNPLGSPGWAGDADNVVIYIADHGGTGNIRINRTEILSGQDLNDWIDVLQSDISGRVTVIIDSCKSGSLQSDLMPPPENKERVVLTSTLPNEKAYFVNQGVVSYSNFFWFGVFNGETIETAHTNAYNSLRDSFSQTAEIILQTPMLNDYPAGISTNMKIGNGMDYHSTAPVIGSVDDDRNISGTAEATITASNVTDPNNNDIARVWAVIMPPDFNLGETDNAVQALPSIELNPTTTAGEFRNTYKSFNNEGEYRIAIYARDSDGEASLPKISKITVGSPLRNRAIIIAGGEQGDPNRTAVMKGAEAAYKALRAQGHSDNEIYYMNNTTSVTGWDALAVESSLTFAINTWTSNDTNDLLVYLIGEGDHEIFHLNLSSSETLNVADLNSLLNNLQNIIGMTGMLTVVSDANYSGGFISQLPPPDGKERILIGSSAGQAFFLSDGDVSFSRYFWHRVLNGWNVREAVFDARSAMEFSTSQQQKAWIDDNGNGIGNESVDGIVAAKHTIGMGIKLAGKDPLIGNVSAIPSDLTANQSVVIHADDVTTVGTLATVNPVWAVVTEPKGPGETTVTQTIVPMTPAGGNNYEGTTGNIFNDFGRYNVTVYAKDDKGNISSVSQTTVYQKGLIDKYEPDNTYDIANEIVLNSSTAQQHNFHVDGDVDWVSFYGKALSGEPYTFSAKTRLGTYSDVVMELHNETTASGGSDPPFPIIWNTPGLHTYVITADGIYYLKVSHKSGGFGDDTGYDLSVYEESGDLYYSTLYGIVRDAASLIPIPGVIVNIPGSLPFTSNEGSGFYTVTVIMDLESEDHTLTAIEPPVAEHENFEYTDTLKDGLQYEVFLNMVPYCWDSDQDGYGDPGDASCSGGITGDCDDGDNLINPGAAEVCDGVDNNCAGGVDEGWPTSSWYVDNDGDGYGNSTIWQDKCYQPSDWVADNTDCDDGDLNIYPGGPEVRILSPLTYYSISLLRDAYVAAGDGGTIQSKTSTYTGDFAFDLNKTVTFEGGYDCSYTTMTGETTINGNVTVDDGMVTLENMEVQ